MASADIITYKFEGEYVYVKPAETYEACPHIPVLGASQLTLLSDLQEALNIAQHEFPALAWAPRPLIGLYKASVFGNDRQVVRISESAWPSATVRLMRGDVVEVHIRDGGSKVKTTIPENTVTPASPAPPSYLDVSTSQSNLGDTSINSRNLRSKPSRGSESTSTLNPRRWFSGRACRLQ